MPTTDLQLGCALDCLYLVTLNNGAGRPVVAARGALTGGAAAATVDAAEGEAGRRRLPRRRAARQPGQPGAGRSAR